MAVITGEFDPETIKKFRGILDYYYWRGLMVVRAWPRKPVLPRNPNVIASGLDFADTARAIVRIPLALQDDSRETYSDSTWTWKDAWTSTAYGHSVDWDYGKTNPHWYNTMASQTSIDFIHIAPPALVTINVNNTSYVYDATLFADMALDFVPFTHYRLQCHGLANAAGQTVDLRVVYEDGVPTPLGSGSADLTLPNTQSTYDSGWKTLVSPPTVWRQIKVGRKGSNATVDLSVAALWLTLGAF